MARRVLSTIWAVGRTFTTIGQRAGDLQQTSLARLLTVFQDKRVVAADTPLSIGRSRDPRYRVADSYLRFRLAFLGPHVPEIGVDAVIASYDRVRAAWPLWRGRAIEPVMGVPGPVARRGPR